MLKHRIISGVILASIVFYGIFYAGLSFFYSLVAIFSVLSIYECYLMAFKDSKVSIFIGTLLSSALALLIVLYADFMHVELIGVCIWLAAFFSLIFYPGFSEKLWSKFIVTGLFFTLAIAAFGFSLIGYKTDPELGNKYILYILLLCWSSDIGAYFSGKKFGRNKMAPSISPNKTLEGLAGGVVCALLVSIGFNIYVEQLSFVAIALGLIISFSAVLGDLFESMIKRIFSVKDSSRLILGHGGVLDRIDSVLPAVTLYYGLSKLFQ